MYRSPRTDRRFVVFATSCAQSYDPLYFRLYPQRMSLPRTVGVTLDLRGSVLQQLRVHAKLQQAHCSARADLLPVSIHFSLYSSIVT